MSSVTKLFYANSVTQNITNDVGSGLSVASTCLAWGAISGPFINGNSSTITITKTGCGAGVVANDVVHIQSGTGITPGDYTVASATANTITLNSSPGTTGSFLQFYVYRPSLVANAKSNYPSTLPGPDESPGNITDTDYACMLPQVYFSNNLSRRFLFSDFRLVGVGTPLATVLTTDAPTSVSCAYGFRLSDRNGDGLGVAYTINSEFRVTAGTIGGTGFNTTTYYDGGVAPSALPDYFVQPGAVDTNSGPVSVAQAQDSGFGVNLQVGQYSGEFGIEACSALALNGFILQVTETLGSSGLIADRTPLLEWGGQYRRFLRG